MSFARQANLKLVLVAVVILAVTFLMVFVVGPHFEMAGTVHGVEFSPDRICHRSFQYVAVLGIQVSPTRTREWRSDVDKYLHDGGFVPPAAPGPARWCFIKGSAPAVRGWIGPARESCWALGCWGASDKWVKWSNKHPELAKVLWPQVVSWLRSEKFHEVFLLLRLTDVKSARTPEDIQDSIASALKQADL